MCQTMGFRRVLGVSSLSSEPFSDRRRLRLAQIEKGSQTVCGVANWLCYLLMLSAEGVERKYVQDFENVFNVL